MHSGWWSSFGTDAMPARRRLRTSITVAASSTLLGFALVTPSADAANPAQDGPAPSQTIASTFQAIGTALAYDSTAGDGPMLPGTLRAAPLAGVPADAQSALVVVTARNASAKGQLAVRQTETGRAIARLNFRAHSAKSAVMLLPVSGARLYLKVSKRSTADVRIDLLGYDLTGNSLKAKGRPAMALATGRLAAGVQQKVAVAHRNGAPGTRKLVAALLKITARKAGAAGGVQVYPVGGAPVDPVAPIAIGQKTSTIALVPTGPTGQLNITSTVDAQVRVELIGYVADTDAPAEPAPAPAPAAPAPPAPAPAASGAAALAVQYALSKVGARYVAGGMGPDSFDCSGLTTSAWATAGVRLTHQSFAQYGQTQRISLADIQPGDLLFYFGNGLHHVTMYVGNGQMVNAANPAAGVVLSSVNEPWYVQHFTGAGRVVA